MIDASVHIIELWRFVGFHGWLESGEKLGRDRGEDGIEIARGDNWNRETGKMRDG